MEDINTTTGIRCAGSAGVATATRGRIRPTPKIVNAQRVDITSYNDGDRKMISPQDLALFGHCGRPHLSGTRLVQDERGVRLVAYYRNSPAAGLSSRASSACFQ